MMWYGVKDLKVLATVGFLPEEELAQQELFIDIAVKSDRTDINEYFLKEIAQTVAAKGFETLQAFAIELFKTLQKELSLKEVELTVKKPSSPIGIPTYVTVT